MTEESKYHLESMYKHNHMDLCSTYKGTTRNWHPPPCTQGNLSTAFSHLRFTAFPPGHLRNLPYLQSNQSTHPSHCLSYHLGGGARASDHSQIKKTAEPPPLCPHLNPAPACYWTDLDEWLHSSLTVIPHFVTLKVSVNWVTTNVKQPKLESLCILVGH